MIETHRRLNEFLSAIITLVWVVFGIGLSGVSLSGVEVSWKNIFRLDAANHPFVFTLGVCSIYIGIFSYFYFSRKKSGFWINLALFLFVLNVAALFLAQNLVILVAAFELTTIFSWVLIAASKHQGSLQAARFVVALTLLGGISFLAFCSLLFKETNSLDLHEALRAYRLSNNTGFLLQVLILISILSKSAIFPFSAWLIRAMVADAPVSALLHSATLVKLGLFLGYLFFPILGEFSKQALIYLGAITAFFCSFRALFCNQLKTALAFSTLASLGVLGWCLGAGLIAEFLNFLIIHALYKSVLFLMVGLMVLRKKGASIQDVATSFTGSEKFLLFLPLFSLIGIPLIGSPVKEFLLDSVLHGSKSIFLVLLNVGTILFLQAFGFKLMRALYTEATPKTSLRFRYLGWMVLALFLAGLVGAGYVHKVPEKTVSQFSEVLTLFLLVASALFGFLKNPDFSIPSAFLFKLQEGFGAFMKSLTARFQNQKFQSYVFSVFACSTALISFSTLNVHFELKWTFISSVLFALLIIAFLGGYLALRSRSRVLTVVSFALAGLSVNFAFLIFGAPDLAITSFLVDLIWLALFILALYKLPPFAKTSISSFKGWAFGLSVSVGVVFFLIAVQPPQGLSALKNAYLVEAERLVSAKNAVNAIVTGFRGFDTVGEIIVLFLAALGFKALVKND